MQLFKITNPSYKGEIEVTYNGNLIKFDFSNAQELAPETISAFKRSIPPTIAEFMKGTWCSAATTIIEADYEVSFLMFWNAYDKKINRKRAEIVFDHLPKSKKIKALLAVKAYDKFLKKESWRPKADPETYLRNEMWENEYK